MNDADRIPALRRLIVWLLAAGVSLLPLLFLPRVMVFGNSDALFYGNILAMTTESLKSGEFFPYWLGQANAGLGSPVMLFYAPLAYIVTALISLPLAPLHMDRDAQMIFGMFAAQLACSYTSFLWLKRGFGERVALTGSLMFMLLPYKFIYIYLHINLAQLWALAILPLWMLAAEDMRANRARAVGAYALAFAAVYYTHPLTLIAFAAVPAIHVLWFSGRNFLQNFAKLGLAHLLGLGICMARLLPAHYSLPWIHAERFLQGNYDWRANLYHIDVMLCAYYGMIALVVAAAIGSIPSLKNGPYARQAWFWIAVLCAVLFLTQKPAAFVYEWLTPLQYLQFPAARLHAAALMAVTWLICFWLAFYREMAPLGKSISGRKTLALMIIVFSIGTGLRLYHLYSDPAFYSDTYRGDAQVADLVSSAEAMYVTRWECIPTKRAYALYEYGQLPPEAAFASGRGAVTSLNWRPPEHIAFTADVQSDDAQLVLRQCYFPLWRARVDGGQLAPHPATDDGLLGLTLPKGSHRVELSMAPPPGAALGGWISLLSLAATMALMAGRTEKAVK